MGGKRGPRSGVVFVLSAPSGTGKTTLSRRLARRVSGLRFSVSYTTRAPRPGERQGVDYHFVTRAAFQRLRRRKAFLEWARVDEELYGTPRDQILRSRARGEDLLLEIDTQGAEQVRRRLRDAVLIFILPPGPLDLRRRLVRRGAEPEVLARRLALARREVPQYRSYDYLVLNDRVEKATRDLEAIVRAERCRVQRQAGKGRRILREFKRGGVMIPAKPRAMSPTMRKEITG
jgi:guanylate kinase